MGRVHGTPCTALQGDAAGMCQEQDPLPVSTLAGRDVPAPHGLPAGQVSSLPSPGSWCLHPPVLHLPGSSNSNLGAEGRGTNGEDTPGSTAAGPKAPSEGHRAGLGGAAMALAQLCTPCLLLPAQGEGAKQRRQQDLLGGLHIPAP